MIYCWVRLRSESETISAVLGFARVPVKGEILALQSLEGMSCDHDAEDETWPDSFKGKSCVVERVMFYAVAPELRTEVIVEAQCR